MLPASGAYWPAAQSAQVACRSSGLNEPGKQTVAAVEPVAQDAPTGHAVQLSACESPGAFEKLPPKHGSSADEPAGQKLPPVHSLHAVAPLSPWNSPAAHLVHVSCRGLGLNVPGEHDVGSAEPTAHAVPAGHSMQSLMRSER